MLILAALSVILVGAIPSAVFGMKAAENRVQAAALAREALEGARKAGFTAAASKDLGSTASNGTDFTLRQVVDAAVTESGALMDGTRVKRVRIRVTWSERGRVRSHVTTTLLSRT